VSIESDTSNRAAEEEESMSEAPALVVVGAHPDDCEITAGGVAALTAARGGRVLHVALTNGDKGHQTLSGAKLATMRRSEARAAAAACGAEAIVLDNHDGELMPTLEHRYELIRILDRRLWRRTRGQGRLCRGL
jgi:LmbE family N-acetylglucosaminyl deacetylase